MIESASNPSWDEIRAIAKVDPNEAILRAYEGAFKREQATSEIPPLPDGWVSIPISDEDKKYLDELELAKRRLKAQGAAKRQLAEENTRADLAYLDSFDSLADALARPEEPVQERVRGLMLVDHNTTVAAPAKTGKTVLQANRVRTYVDGEPLFGAHELVTPLDGNVGIFNYELSERQMIAWYRGLGIRHPERVFVRHLRGRGLFLQDDAACEAAIRWLKLNDIEVWEIDPLQAALRGTVNDDAVASEWIANVEKVKAEAGVRDLVLTVHMGHAASYKDADVASERAIGSARWTGWPDNMWTYMKDGSGTRFLRATGRDVDHDEFALDMDPSTRLLSSKGSGTNRHQAGRAALQAEILSFLGSNPGATTSAIKAGVTGKGEAITRELGFMAQGEAPRITVTLGPRSAKLYSVMPSVEWPR